MFLQVAYNSSGQHCVLWHISWLDVRKREYRMDCDAAQLEPALSDGKFEKVSLTFQPSRHMYTERGILGLEPLGVLTATYSTFGLIIAQPIRLCSREWDSLALG